MVFVFVFGFFSGLMDLAMNTNAVLVEKKLNKSIMSSFHAAWSIGGMIGATVGGLLESIAWTLIQHFAVVSAGGLILALGSQHFLIAEKDLDDGDDDTSTGGGSTCGVSPAHVSLLILSTICCCSFVSEGAIGDWSALYMQDVVKADPAIAAMGYAAFSFAMAGGRLSGDAVITRYTDGGALLAGGILSALGVLLVVANPNQYLALAGFACAGVGLSVQVPISFRLAGRATSRPSAEALASVARAGYFGLLAGPSIFGYLAEWFGLRASLSVLMIFGISTVALALRIRAVTSRPTRN